MFKFRKSPKVDRGILDSHKEKIIEDLDFEHEPIVIYGEDAIDFLRRYDPTYQDKSNKQILSSVRGFFLYENLPDEYMKTGVVCVFNGKIATLAHELCHAKQYQDNNKWMKRGKWLKIAYKLFYAFYPTEKEAFQYAHNYLKKAKLKKLAFLYRFKIISAIFPGSRILVYLFFVALILGLFTFTWRVLQHFNLL